MPDMTKFKELYLSEAQDHLENLNKNLLALEKDLQNKNILNELMRSAHTIKGSSAAMGYVKTAFLTHILEDVFDYARNDTLEISKELINKLFETLDSLDASLKSIKENDAELNTDDIARELKTLTGVATEGFGKSARTLDGKPLVENTPETVVQTIEYIKVPVKRLDDLMNLAEELLIDKMRLEQQAPREMSPLVKHMSRIISDIQYQVMQSRLVAVEQVFARFPRMVRDLATKLDKDIEFEISGGDIELDRTVIDQLGTPLIHLLRNAVDHGIEKKGKITLKALREKNLAVIEVSDDGQGINWQKVVDVAVKRGYVTGDKAKDLSPEEKINLIFRPQMSTNDQVTETSGRGVGLNVVKGFCESVRGEVKIISPALDGKGTTFRLELPSTLAIIKSLIIKTNDQFMALPFTNVVRSVQIKSDQIKSMADQDVAIIDEEDVPLVWLTTVFNPNSTDKKEDPYTVVIISIGSQQAGLVVDELVSEQEIIVKPLAPILKKVKGFSGSTILGDGRTILILDTVSLLSNTKKH